MNTFLNISRNYILLSCKYSIPKGLNLNNHWLAEKFAERETQSVRILKGSNVNNRRLQPAEMRNAINKNPVGIQLKGRSIL